MKKIPYDLIAARTVNRGIGMNGSLPWNLPPDMKMFKKITTSGSSKNAIIMGRKTFESLSKPLPGRLNIVISRNSKLEENENLKQARSVEEGVQLAHSLNPEGKIYVVGGSKIYENAFADCRYVYQTLINRQIQCDTFFPQHNFPCLFVSKTHKHQNLIYDHRLFHNNAHSRVEEQQSFFSSLPKHEQYQYMDLVEKIINKGEDKMDRTGTGTRSIFGDMMRYDLEESFPVLTHKRVFWRGVAEQLLWFVSGSTNAKELEEKKIHIWDGNSSKQYLNSIGIDREAGDLGPVYGFQWRHWNAAYTTMHEDYTNQGIDQLQWIINEIKTNPNSRRLIMTAWNPGQLKEMALPPCHMMCQFYVSSNSKLNCLLYQRSCDIGLGVPFNIASYSLLTCLIAQVTGLKRGEFVHVLGDLHLYSDHIESLKHLKNVAPYPFPELELDPTIKNIDDFTMEHIKLKGYKSHPKIAMKMSV